MKGANNMKLKNKDTLYYILNTMLTTKNYLNFKYNLAYPGEVLERYEEKKLLSSTEELKSLTLFAYEYINPLQEHELKQRAEFLNSLKDHNNIFIRLLANNKIESIEELKLLSNEGKEELAYALLHLPSSLNPNDIEAVISEIPISIKEDFTYLSMLSEYGSTKPYFRLIKTLKTKELKDIEKAAYILNIPVFEVYYLNYMLNPDLTAPARIRIITSLIVSLIQNNIDIPDEVLRWADYSASNYRKEYSTQNFWLDNIFYNTNLKFTSPKLLSTVLSEISDNNKSYKLYKSWSFNLSHKYIAEDKNLWDILTESLKHKFISNLSELASTISEYNLLKIIASQTNYDTNTFPFIKLEFDLKIKDIFDYSNITYNVYIDKYLSTKSQQEQISWMEFFYHSNGLLHVGKYFFEKINTTSFLKEALEEIYLELLFYYSPSDFPLAAAKFAIKNNNPELAEFLVQNNLIKDSYSFSYSDLKKIYMTEEKIEAEKLKKRIQQIESHLSKTKSIYIYFEVKDKEYEIPVIRELVKSTLIAKSHLINDKHDALSHVIKFSPNISNEEIGILYKEVILNENKSNA